MFVTDVFVGVSSVTEEVLGRSGGGFRQNINTDSISCDLKMSIIGT